MIYLQIHTFFVLGYLCSYYLTNLCWIKPTCGKSLFNTYLFYFHLDISGNELWLIWMLFILVQKLNWIYFDFFRVFIINNLVDCILCLFVWYQFTCNPNLFVNFPLRNQSRLFYQTFLVIVFVCWTSTLFINMFCAIDLIYYKIVRSVRFFGFF